MDMNKAILNSMTEAERRIIAETEREALRELDEDALLDLHTRIRRARTKYVKLYRREASARVSELGGRGTAAPKNQRNRDKAEIFELALARISHRVGVVAKEAADRLRKERLEAARRVRKAPELGRPEPIRRDGTTGRRVPQAKTTGGLKKDASTRALGARRQAKRDSS
jgi:hypothetical protein